MRVTQESDYAIRICCVLDEADGLLDAQSIASRAAITKSTALKVLKKLKTSGIVESKQGAIGGYELSHDPKELTVYNIIESVEGSVFISKCLSDEHYCSKNKSNKSECKMHIAFDVINRCLVNKLEQITVRSITSPTVTVTDIKEKLK